MRRNSSMGVSPPRARSARRSSRCRHPAPAPARRCDGLSPAWSPMASGAVCTQPGPSPPGVVERGAGLHQPAVDEADEGHARLGPLAGEHGKIGLGERLHRGDALGGGVDIGLLALDADEMAAEPPGDRACGAGAEERVEHDVAGPCGRHQDAGEQRFRLLGRVKLVALVVLQPLGARADGKQPVGAHLHVVVGGLQRLVVEGVALRLLVARGPDQRLMRVLEAAAAENSASGWSCARPRR